MDIISHVYKQPIFIHAQRDDCWWFSNTDPSTIRRPHTLWSCYPVQARDHLGVKPAYRLLHPKLCLPSRPNKPMAHVPRQPWRIQRLRYTQETAHCMWSIECLQRIQPSEKRDRSAWEIGLKTLP